MMMNFSHFCGGNGKKKHPQSLLLDVMHLRQRIPKGHSKGGMAEGEGTTYRTLGVFEKGLTVPCLTLGPPENITHYAITIKIPKNFSKGKGE